VCSSVSGSTQKISKPKSSVSFFDSPGDGITRLGATESLLALIAAYIASKSTAFFVGSSVISIEDSLSSISSSIDDPYVFDSIDRFAIREDRIASNSSCRDPLEFLT